MIPRLPLRKEAALRRVRHPDSLSPPRCTSAVSVSGRGTHYADETIGSVRSSAISRRMLLTPKSRLRSKWCVAAFGIALETRRPSGESDGQNDFDLQNPPQMLLRIGRDQYGSIAPAPLRGLAMAFILRKPSYQVNSLGPNCPASRAHSNRRPRRSR
jgi:hypothetical protein